MRSARAYLAGHLDLALDEPPVTATCVDVQRLARDLLRGHAEPAPASGAGGSPRRMRQVPGRPCANSPVSTSVCARWRPSLAVAAWCVDAGHRVAGPASRLALGPAAAPLTRSPLLRPAPSATSDDPGRRWRCLHRCSATHAGPAEPDRSSVAQVRTGSTQERRAGSDGMGPAVLPSCGEPRPTSIRAGRVRRPARTTSPGLDDGSQLGAARDRVRSGDADVALGGDRAAASPMPRAGSDRARRWRSLTAGGPSRHRPPVRRPVPAATVPALTVPSSSPCRSIGTPIIDDTGDHTPAIDDTGDHHSSGAALDISGAGTTTPDRRRAGAHCHRSTGPAADPG